MPRQRKPKSDTPRNAFSSGIGLLARREHSSRELKTKLARRGHQKTEIDEAVDRLSGAHYQSDERFGVSIARTRISQGYGPRRIRAELKSHGVTEPAIRAALDAANADWTLVASTILRRRFGAKGPADIAERGRRAQFLLRRGFDPATVRAVTRAVVDDPGEEFD
ncbi:MAG TPA: regulatory protein RecX [Rhodanobacteraceae bacterium]|nr:regulatory protein RecX [Rhodanobacteraceae bacterium]